MSSHPRFNGQAFSIDDPRSNGWYSRKHQNGRAHMEARQEEEARIYEREKVLEDNRKARKARSPQQQINVLDKRLGKGVGAKKERKRLLRKIK